MNVAQRVYTQTSLEYRACCCCCTLACDKHFYFFILFDMPHATPTIMILFHAANILINREYDLIELARVLITIHDIISWFPIAVCGGFFLFADTSPHAVQLDSRAVYLITWHVSMPSPKLFRNSFLYFIILLHVKHVDRIGRSQIFDIHFDLRSTCMPFVSHPIN